MSTSTLFLMIKIENEDNLSLSIVFLVWVFIHCLCFSRKIPLTKSWVHRNCKNNWYNATTRGTFKDFFKKLQLFPCCFCFPIVPFSVLNEAWINKEQKVLDRQLMLIVFFELFANYCLSYYKLLGWRTIPKWRLRIKLTFRLPESKLAGLNCTKLKSTAETRSYHWATDRSRWKALGSGIVRLLCTHCHLLYSLRSTSLRWLVAAAQTSGGRESHCWVFPYST